MSNTNSRSSCCVWSSSSSKMNGLWSGKYSPWSWDVLRCFPWRWLSVSWRWPVRIRRWRWPCFARCRGGRRASLAILFWATSLHYSSPLSLSQLIMIHWQISKIVRWHEGQWHDGRKGIYNRRSERGARRRQIQKTIEDMFLEPHTLIIHHRGFLVLIAHCRSNSVYQ
jgi:hypothetical protein